MYKKNGSQWGKQCSSNLRYKKKLAEIVKEKIINSLKLLLKAIFLDETGVGIYCAFR